MKKAIEYLSNEGFLPKLGHIGIVASDMDAAIISLNSIFDVEKGSPYYFIPQRCWSNGNEIYDCKIEICMLQWNEIKIELLVPVSGDIEHKKFLEKNGAGIHHLAFNVDDFNKYKEIVIDRAYDVIFETETNDEKGFRRCLYARIPDLEILIEILENIHEKDDTLPVRSYGGKK